VREITKFVALAGVATIGIALAMASSPPPRPVAPDPPLVGSRVRVQGMPGVSTLLDVRRPLNYGQYRWDDRGIPAGTIRIRVDRTAQLISVFQGRDEIGTAVILYGVNAKPTPPGKFPILDKRRDYWSRTYDAPMPYALRLTSDGVAIHASDVRPGRGTNGCIGLPDAFARRLFERAKPGDIVEIV
jgi:hypothetical protein